MTESDATDQRRETDARPPGSVGLSPTQRDLLAALLRERGLAGQARGDAGVIPRRTVQTPVPLNVNQEGLWFMDQLDESRAGHGMPGTVRIRGRLDLPALEAAFTEIVRRHETLRTTFPATTDGMPMQVIGRPVAVRIPMQDLESLTPAAREPEALRRAAVEACRPFDLARGPLFRATLLRLGVEDHVLCVDFHHIIADGWSMSVFTREWVALYEAFAAGRPSPLPEVPIQYADFAVWQRERLRGPILAASLAFWRGHLAGSLPSTELPPDRPRPARPTLRGAHEAVTLTRELSEGLRALARAGGVTLYVVLLAAFQVVLHARTKATDLVTGATFANRGRKELEGLIGFFVNTLPLRTDLSGDPGFREIMRRVREVVLAAGTHQEIPLRLLVREVRPERQAGSNPLYRLVFDLLTPDLNPALYGYGLASTVHEALALSGLTVTPMDVEGGVARFDLAMFLWDQPAGIAGTVEYSTDLFEVATIRGVVLDLEGTLETVVGDPHARLSALAERLHAARQDGQGPPREGAYRHVAHQRLRDLRQRPLPRTLNEQTP